MSFEVLCLFVLSDSKESPCSEAEEKPEYALSLSLSRIALILFLLVSHAFRFHVLVVYLCFGVITGLDFSSFYLPFCVSLNILKGVLKV